MESTVHARYLDVRLFLEGIEVDVVSVKTTCGVNKSATAVITIPAVDAAHKLLPRTLVHLFYFDSRYELGTFDYTKSMMFSDGGSGQTTVDRLTNKGSPKKHQENVDAGTAALLKDKDDWHNWKLLFTGEVTGYTFSKVGGRREIILACHDHTSYWSNCRLYWGQKRSSVFNAYKTAVFSGGTQLYRGKNKVDSSGDLLKLLQKKPSSMPSVPGLMGGIFSVLESATGVFMPETKSQFRGANDFLSQAEIRLKLTRQVGASIKDNTSSVFTSSKSFKRFLLKASKSVSYTATFTQFMNMLCSKIYHVWHSQLAPAYFAEGDEVEAEYAISGPSKYKHHSGLKAFEKALLVTYREANRQNNESKARRGRIKTGAATTPFNRDYILWNEEGKVDVVNHKKFDDLNLGTGILSPKTGVSGDPKTKLGSANSIGIGEIEKDPFFIEGHKIKKNILSKAKGDKVLRRQADAIQQAYRFAGLARMRAAAVWDAQSGVDAAKYDPDESAIHAGNLLHNDVNYLYIRRNIELARKQLARATGRQVRVLKKKVELNDRLYTTYFHPDIYMCPPPKCNVLFPDSIQSISFSRNWMSEVSRLWLHGKSESGKNQKDCYFSPNGTMLGGPDVGDCAQAVRKGGGFVMKHEKYTGIIPSIMGLGDNDIFKKLHKRALRKAKKEFLKDPKNKGKTFDSAAVSGEAKFSPQPHLQRAANYLFFAQRYGARTMQVTCRYSPQLIAGVPALILDPIRQKSRVMAQVGGTGEDRNDARYKGEINLNNKPIGTHYVGTISDIVHIIDVGGGAQTLITLVKCREHTEGANLFGERDEAGQVTAARTRTIRDEVLVKPPKGETHKAGVSKAFGAGGSATGNVSSSAIVTNTAPEDARKILSPNVFKKGTRYRIKPVKGDGPGGYTMTSMPNIETSTSAEANKARLLDPTRQYDELGNDIGSVEGVEVEVWEQRTRTKSSDVSFTWEASVMPPWFSNIYNPTRIGTDYYSQMYGCLSVLDKPPITFSGSSEYEATSISVTKGKVVEADWSYDKEKATEDNPTGFQEKESPSGIATITVPFKISGPGGKGDTEYTELRIPQELTEPSATTEAAADNLADTWLALKEIGAQTDLFVDGYVNRKYATMVDVMGNQNPHFMPKVYNPYTTNTLQRGSLTGGYAQRGFHGDAYGPYKELKDWNNEAIVPTILPAVKDGIQPKPRQVDAAIDPRYIRYARVREYLNALRNQGFRNVGAEYSAEASEARNS
ncbi:MAG: hypothetical protein CL582_09645 [Alteromonadaceae bacterium]|nr:hypothetical protein [Alteromonadaceae bacterium]